MSVSVPSLERNRYFVKNYSKIAWPLLDLTKKMTPWHWGEDQFKAFETLKTKMCSAPALRQPDFSKRFFVQTDASAKGVGAILSQEGEIKADLDKNTYPKLHPITFFS